MLLDVLSVVIGVLFTFRKLDVRGREAAHFPQVDPGLFEEWKAAALRSYNLGASVCFAYVVLDCLNHYGASRILPGTVIQLAGFLLFLGWVGLLVYAWVLAGRARGLQEKAGIQLAAPLEPRSPG
jgi:hypothetical protein